MEADNENWYTIWLEWDQKKIIKDFFKQKIINGISKLRKLLIKDDPGERWFMMRPNLGPRMVEGKTDKRWQK